MNFSLSEIIVVLLIALLVIKPEQLPEVAHTLGKIVRSIRHLFNKMKEEVTSFVALEEISEESKREK